MEALGAAWGVHAGNYVRLSHKTSSGAIITPKQAWTIDKKMDDGLPLRGYLIGRYGYGGPVSGCFEGAAGSEVYDLDLESVDCILHWYFDKM